MRLIRALAALAWLRAYRYAIMASRKLAELAVWIGPGAPGNPR